MKCSGLHCGGCGSGGGGAPLASLLFVGAVGFVAYRMTGSAVAGLSASVAEANRAVGVAVAVVLVVAAVTVGGWMLLAGRRRVREDPVVAELSAQVQAALDARPGGAPRRIAPGPPPAVPIARVTAYRLDGGVDHGSTRSGGR